MTKDDSTIENDLQRLHEKYLAERDKRLRADGNRQYIGIEKDFASYADDPRANPGFARAPVAEDIDVLIVGGGLSGLISAGSLTSLGIGNFRIIDRAADFGGTWYWNRYPGCRCDVDSYIYFPLVEQTGTMPPEKYSRASVIYEHARTIGRQLGLYERAYFQTSITRIRWDSVANRWIVSTDRQDRIRARFVILGSGPLNRPKLPGIPGIETFKGKAFHTSRWDYSYTGGNEEGNLEKLRDKKVAVIGTGATGVQVIPPLSEWAQRLYVVQRTPAAVDARMNKLTDAQWYSQLKPGWWRQRAENFEGFLLGIPQDEDLVADGWTATWTRFTDATKDRSSPELMAQARQLVDYEKMREIRARISRIVRDPGTAGALKPYYNWFCKRPLFHDGYYESFNRSNVTLINTDGRSLDRIIEHAIEFDGKSYEVDCIIFASGFEAAVQSDRSGGFDLIGKGGVTLADAWRRQMGSLHGMFVRGFPNVGVVGGIKQGAASFNFTYISTMQSRHLACVIKRCLVEGTESFEISQAAQDAWLSKLREKAQVDMKFLRECTPGYYNNEGQDLEHALFAATYGGGLFEYVAILDEWRRSGYERDLEFKRRPCNTAA